MVYEVLGHPGIKYRPEELEFYVTFDYIEEVVSEIQTVNIGYWEQLKHQAAIAAMQGLCVNSEWNDCTWEVMAEDAIDAAHALVEKMKEERK